MAFEKFIAMHRYSRSNTPKISIWASQQIYFNTAAIVEYNIDSYKYAVLYFDKPTNRIGIRLSETLKEGGVKLLRSNKTRISIRAYSFLRHFGIKITKSKHFNLEYDTTTKMFIINLEKMFDS